MTDPLEDFDNVQWDVQDDTHPAVMDPLSEMNDSFMHTLDLTPFDTQHTQSSPHEHSPSPPPPQPQPPTMSASIRVTEPRKENDGQSTFVSYAIVSSKTTVRRRFQDFVWLFNVLYTNYPACIVPPLPDKHRLEYVKGDRFGTEFLEKRRTSMERFLQRIARHPVLGRASFFVKFLESSDFNDASARALREGQETMMDTLGDSLLNAFAKIRKPDPQFVEMKDRVDRLEENFVVLEKTLSRTNKRTEDLSRDYKELAASIQGLAPLETSVESGLDLFAQATDKYATHLATLATYDTEWLGEIHDYMSYHNAMKDVLKLRDQKQLDFEELTDYLQSTLKEREKTMYPSRTDGGTNLTGFLTNKLNEVRGADSEKIRRERVLRLDDRIRELQDAIEQTHEVSDAFSDQVKKENEFFVRNNAIEMHDALETYTGAKIDFYEKGVELWRNVVQSLEAQE
ncbi:hypothetical protein [Absidia glauca]|uniref:Sorting nexin-4 n=1 Tax=Absidia glauca TaxID=4829 RepID=A0A163J9L7_ABSGL|nr:hypothetical protein [Absidia glauca]